MTKQVSGIGVTRRQEHQEHLLIVFTYIWADPKNAMTTPQIPSDFDTPLISGHQNATWHPKPDIPEGFLHYIPYPIFCPFPQPIGSLL